LYIETTILNCKWCSFSGATTLKCQSDQSGLYDDDDDEHHRPIQSVYSWSSHKRMSTVTEQTFTYRQKTFLLHPHS